MLLFVKVVFFLMSNNNMAVVRNFSLALSLVEVISEPLGLDT